MPTFYCIHAIIKTVFFPFRKFMYTYIYVSVSFYPFHSCAYIIIQNVLRKGEGGEAWLLLLLQFLRGISNIIHQIRTHIDRYIKYILTNNKKSNWMMSENCAAYAIDLILCVIQAHIMDNPYEKWKICLHTMLRTCRVDNLLSKRSKTINFVNDI